MKVQCYKLKKKLAKKDEDKSPNCARYDNDSNGEVMVVTVGVSDIDDEWILSSVYTYHMCPHNDRFSIYEPIHNIRSLLGFEDSYIVQN